jgi:hypothetical protein
MSNGGPTYEEIWQTLRSIDISQFVETIPGRGKGLSYLSWPHAWSVLCEVYPQATFQFETYRDETDTMVYADGTASVTCTITIGNCFRTVSLPVMDNKHGAISNPDARQVSDARQRCLVKALAFFGLGLELYAGEDLPKPATKATKKSPGPDPDELAAVRLRQQIDQAETEAELQALTPAAKNLTQEWKDRIRPIYMSKIEDLRLAQDQQNGFSDEGEPLEYRNSIDEQAAAEAAHDADPGIQAVRAGLELARKPRRA